MISIEVKDMTCGHCEATLRKAIAAVDERAAVNADLTACRLNIESAADANRLIAAVRTAGYTPGSISVVAASTPAEEKRGCCRG